MEPSPPTSLTHVISSEFEASDLLPRYTQTHVDDSWFNEETAADDLKTLWSVSQVAEYWTPQPNPSQETSSTRRPYVKDGVLTIPGHQWAPQRTPPNSLELTKKRKLSNPSPPAAQSSSTKPRKKRTRSGRGEISSASFKAARDCKPRQDGYREKNQKKLANRQLRISHTISSETFDIITHGNFSKPGWQGHPPPRLAMDLLLSRYRSGEIKQDLSTFFPIPYPMPPLASPVPAIVTDRGSHIFCYRSTQIPWGDDMKREFCDGIETLLKKQLSDPELKRKCMNGSRGPHYACVLGHAQQYKDTPDLTCWDKEHRKQVLEFQALPSVKSLIGFASSIVALIFPGVKERFERSARWHQETHGIEPDWGVFWNFCINATFRCPGAPSSVNTFPHLDKKNGVTVCLTYIYVMPWAKFNHTQRSWLVVWEAGVIIELPPWVVIAYPSSLLVHFNIDISDIKFVTTEGDARPTPATCRPLVEGDDAGRGSCVFFNQASMYAASETGHGTISASRLAGGPTTSNYSLTAQEAFHKHIYG